MRNGPVGKNDATKSASYQYTQLEMRKEQDSVTDAEGSVVRRLGPNGNAVTSDNPFQPVPSLAGVPFTGL